MSAEKNGTVKESVSKPKSVFEQRKELIAKNEEYVSVQLYKDNDKYSEPLFVSVNGENCVIQRGIPVRVNVSLRMLSMNHLNRMEKLLL